MAAAWKGQQGDGIVEGYASIVEKRVLTYLLVHILKEMFREFDKLTDDCAYMIG